MTTTRKAPAKKITVKAPATDFVPPSAVDAEEYDFDSQTEEDLEASIDAAAKAFEIRFVISEKRLFVARFPDGQIIKVPLKLSVDDIDIITESHDNPVDQIRELFRRLGDEDTVTTLAGKPFPSVVSFASKYFNVFNRMAGLTAGE